MFTFNDETHTYFWNGVPVPSVTQILQAEGYIDDRYYNEAARIRGTYVHVACQYLDEGGLDTENLDPIIIPYLSAYERFKQEARFVPELIEVQRYSETYRFAGTFDRIGELDGREVLIDLKTGAKDDWHGLQLAAYTTLIDQELPRYTLELRADGDYRLHAFRDPTDRQVFLSALTGFYWKQSHGGKRL